VQPLLAGEVCFPISSVFRSINTDMKILPILGYSVVSMVIATAIVGFILKGFYGVLGTPFLMLFGWFYFPVIVILQAAAFYGWRFFVPVPYGRAYFILIGMVVASALFSLIGIKEQGSEWRYTIAYAVASSVAALISCMWISSRGPSLPQ
jgi:hypothetical protein